MSDMIEYKGYHGQISYSHEDEVFYGKIYVINDLVTFEGGCVNDLKRAFKEAVEDYLKTCESLGKEPEKEYKSLFNVRISPSLHKKITLKAAHKRQSLNKFIESALRKAIKDSD